MGKKYLNVSLCNIYYELGSGLQNKVLFFKCIFCLAPV